MKTRLHIYSLAFIGTLNSNKIEWETGHGFDFSNIIKCDLGKSLQANSTENPNFQNDPKDSDDGNSINPNDKIPLEEQLNDLQDETLLYNRLDRMIKQSAEYTMPETKASIQNIYPPPKSGTIETIDDGPETIPISSESLAGKDDEMTISETYDPVKVPSGANTTMELITGVAQMPKCQNVEGFDTSFKIKDYTAKEPGPIYEADVLLKRVNQERVMKGKPELKFPGGREEIMKDPEFNKELRQLRYKSVQDYRREKHAMRNEIAAQEHTYYRKLPINDRGYRQLAKADIDKLSHLEMREELRNRGYTTAGCMEDCKIRLAKAIEENSEWRWKHIVSQKLSGDNMNLPLHARQRIADIEKKIDLLNRTSFNSDLATSIERLRARADIIQFQEDPVGYLDLDQEAPTADLTPEEIEQIKSAPVVYDVDFIKAMEAPINRLPDIIPPTFNLDPESTRVYPDMSHYDPNEIAELKREYLSIDGGIHEQTLPVGLQFALDTLQEISERFEISLDFLGDACCRLGGKAPIDLDLPLRGIISYSAMWDLIQYLNIADPMEVDLYYSPFTVEQLAIELGETLDAVLMACQVLEIKLPFGNSTRLNLHCQSAVDHLFRHYKKERLREDAERIMQLSKDSGAEP